MVDRVSVSVAITTIVAVLAKLAFLYSEANEPWFHRPVNQHVFYVVSISVFLVFFRGKMMHDDSPFFTDLETGEKFKDEKYARVRIKSGLMAGYLSWLCWAPAVYFMERPSTLGLWLLVSLLFSTAWLVADITTRKASSTDAEARKRPWFLVANFTYAAPLAFMVCGMLSPAIASGTLVFILLVDWLVSDTLGPFAPTS